MSARYRVLLVDDDPGLLQLLSIRLTRARFDVHTADSSERALTLIPECKPHVVVTDLRMQGLDGMALFNLINESRPLLPVIVLTAHGTIPDAVDATQRGVFAYLTKPYDGDELIAQIRRATAISGPLTASQPADTDDSWREEILCRSAAMEELLSQAKMVAASDISVVILGESGTGKELLARAIHRGSPRHAAPFVAVECTTFPEALLESELFGHRKGAFTGAAQDREGLFRTAHGGTLFLDEIGDMPLALQGKVLRALQEKDVRPVGSNRRYEVDVRVLAATHRDLERLVEAGQFREDLFYRLNVVTLELPSLAARPEDIPLLAKRFLEDAANHSSRRLVATGFAADAMELLVNAKWPGNVRHLRNVVSQCAVLATTPLISGSLVRRALRAESPNILSLTLARDRFYQDYLVRLLRMADGNVARAARIANHDRSDLYKLLRRHKIDPGVYRDRGA